MTELTNLDMTELANHNHRSVPKEEAGRLVRLKRRDRIIKDLDHIWKEITQYGAEAADYVALRRGDPPKWEDLASLVADSGSETAFLSLFITDKSTLLFVLRQSQIIGVVETDLNMFGWGKAVLQFEKDVHNYNGTDQHDEETWDRPFRLLFEKATTHLTGVERIIFAPHALGHVIPWSVIAWRMGWKTSDGLPLQLITLPTIGVLPHLRQRSSCQGDQTLVAGNPLGDLKYAEGEAREVARMLKTIPLIGRYVTKKAVLERLSNSSIVHLSTHAYFDPESPLESGIILSDGILTAREIISNRLQADLVVLSACQTGIALPLAGDELAGLAQAFLFAGARSLLVSLWVVDDMATATLMNTFYSGRQEGVDNAHALSQAMAVVQTREEWSHPYYWGSFILIGE